jgi:hypothetical protein
VWVAVAAQLNSVFSRITVGCPIEDADYFIHGLFFLNLKIPKMALWLGL